MRRKRWPSSGASITSAMKPYSLQVNSSRSVSSGSNTSVAGAAWMKRDCTRLMISPRRG